MFLLIFNVLSCTLTSFERWLALTYWIVFTTELKCIILSLAHSLSYHRHTLCEMTTQKVVETDRTREECLWNIMKYTTLRPYIKFYKLPQKFQHNQTFILRVSITNFILPVYFSIAIFLYKTINFTIRAKHVNWKCSDKYFFAAAGN